MLRLVPRWIRYAVLIAVVLSWVPLVLIARARAVRSHRPRVHIFQDMGVQPRFGPQDVNPAFADHRAMREPVAGTVARGRLEADEGYYHGTRGGKFVDRYPARVREKLTADFLRRGHGRFNIYCAPCHGLDGYGNGMIHQRAIELEQTGWIAPSSLHTEQTRGRELGFLFNTVTNGVVAQGQRRMPAYGPQIPVEDRWAIVAYVRALQRSQNTRYDELSEQEKRKLR